MRPRYLSLYAFLLALLAVKTQAAPVPVYNTNNSLVGSLRQAIQDANPAGGDTIVFQIPTTDPGYNANTGVFTIGLTDLGGTSGELVINKNLTIDGGGQKIAVKRADADPFRIFNITAGTVVLSGLTIRDGHPAVTTVNGGGILNNGNLTVRNCTFVGNDADAGGAGGGIRNTGVARVSNCTFYGNLAGVAGTAIANEGDLTLDNSTIFGNQAPAPSSDGAGVYSSGTTRVRNTIIVGNTRGSAAKDVSGSFISEGYNLIGTLTGSSGFGSTGDQLGASAADAKLSPLQDHGGPTHTMRPMPGSVAIDQGKRGLDANNQPINLDQRDYLRPIDLSGIQNAVGGDGSDIGAVETGPVQAGPTFTVTNSRADFTAGPCTTEDCTLLNALTAANADSDMSTINFALGVGPVIAKESFITGYPITAPVNIVGPGARQLTIRGFGAGQFRIFNVSSTNVTISGLTLRQGRAVGANDSGRGGGAIYNSGGLALIDCTIKDSFACSCGSGVVASGGALFNAAGATMTLLNCTVSGNSSDEFGGGVYSDGILTATNSTFYNNSAVRGGGLISRHAGGAAMMTLRNCTITGNTATDGVSMPGFGGGGVFAEGNNQQYFAANNIIAFNSATNDPDVRGQFTSEGHNLVRIVGDSTGWGASGDLLGTDPQLGSFGNLGGPTDTWSLLSNSPAKNAGDNALAPQKDQRGYLRSGVSDIGAFEFGGTPPPPVPLAGVVSRKMHGATSFDINLPLTGNPGVECRTGGASGDHKLIFTFVNNLTSVGYAAVTSGTGSVSSQTIGANAHNYIVNLTGVSNAQVITVRLTNVNDSAGNSSSSVPISIGVLMGDTTGSGSVNSSDIGQTKSRSGQAVSVSNFRSDVTVSGSINASDIGLVKSKSGTALP